MVNIRFTAVLKDVTENGAGVEVICEHNGKDAIVATFLPEMMYATLRGMRDANEDAFYKAMGMFADEDFENLIECFKENE